MLNLAMPHPNWFGQARRVSSGNRRPSGRFLHPSEIRAHVGAPLAARLAGEPPFDVGKPNVIRPSVGVDCRRVAAVIIRAIDQDAAYAAFAHLAEGDFSAGGWFRASPMIPPIAHQGKPLGMVAWAWDMHGERVDTLRCRHGVKRRVRRANQTSVLM
jgi:hypothetical protein